MLLTAVDRTVEVLGIIESAILSMDVVLLKSVERMTEITKVECVVWIVLENVGVSMIEVTKPVSSIT